MQTERQTDTKKNRQTGRQTDTQTDRKTNRQTDRQTDTETERQTGRETDRQTDRQTDTDSQKDRHTDWLAKCRRIAVGSAAQNHTSNFQNKEKRLPVLLVTSAGPRALDLEAKELKWL